MIIQAEKTGNVAEFGVLVDRMAKDDRVKSILILACTENGFTPESVDDILTSVEKPIFGGIFPEIIFGREKLTRGCIVAGLFYEAQVQVVPGLSDNKLDYEEMIDDSMAQCETKTMFVLVDGLATRITALIDSLFTVFGLECNYIGGGAGSLSFEQKPCLLTNQGLIQDAALLAMLNTESGVGVSHGWMDVAGPFKVTESDRNVMITLDWKPAFQVYREIVESHCGRAFSDDNFFDIAKSYPFGIQKLGAEKIVRDPFRIAADDSLVCVGEIPQESYVHILTGDAASLVGAAKTAMLRSEHSFHGQMEDRTILFIDCISRVLFLEDQFADEIDAIYHEGVPLIGALTLGEIANNGKDYLEFYNKTSVVGILEG
ncbi:MAG: FIST signal transduction protein [Planctomycetota bacterium]|jgi:hypothetical protein